MILPLEKQVASLELSKRLKELGVEQESLFYWYSDYEGGVWIDNELPSNRAEKGDCSAFTVAELGEMLPKFTETLKVDGGYKIIWLENETGKPFRARESTEADARATMLIHLIEQGIIEPGKVQVRG